MSRARDRADSSPTISGDLTVSGDLVPSTALSHRNMIINGGMVVNQRGETPNKNSTTLYAADRWKPQSTGLDQCDFTFTQSSTDAPTDKGFDKSLRLLMGTAESSTGVNEYLRLRYVIESNELRPLCFGTPSAKNFTLSFWVRSSVTQTWAGNIAESSGSKNIGFTFSIDAANTWEKKEITFVGNTHDVPPLNNTAGLYIYIYLAAGTNHYGTANTTWAAATATRDADGMTNTNTLILTAGATFNITGIQLELGSSATPFEHRSYGDELARCQRYCYRMPTTGTAGTYDQVCAGFRNNSTYLWAPLSLPCEMRGIPVITHANLAIWYGTQGSWSTTFTGLSFYGYEFPSNIAPFSLSGISTSISYGILSFQNGGYIQLSAEL